MIMYTFLQNVRKLIKFGKHTFQRCTKGKSFYFEAVNYLQTLCHYHLLRNCALLFNVYVNVFNANRTLSQIT